MKNKNPLTPRLLRLLKNCYLDFKYSRRLLIKKVPKMADVERGYSDSQNSDYQALATLFSAIDTQEDDIFVDIGCGNGRLFNWLLHQEFKNKMIGIDVNYKVATLTKQKFKKYAHIEVCQADVTEYLPHGSIYYLFNPFTLKTMECFATQLEKRIVLGLYKKERPLIIYYHCRYIDRFRNNPYWKIKELGSVSFSNLPAALIYGVSR